uniref:Uncharacterized protein n=1 Tax=Anopheles albimanus TaxID=7167 RepID=A0A182FUR2_ANOAL
MLILQQHGAESQELNTPPLITVDRHWRIRENTTLGTIIARVHADDNEDDTLEFGMDALVAGQDQPFAIDPHSGIVTLNRSVEGRAGQNFFVYVTVTDGSVTSKNEVYVNILARNATGLYKSRVPQFTPSIDNIRQILPPGFNLPGMSSRPQVPLPLLPPQFTRSPPVTGVPQEPGTTDDGVTPPSTKQTKTYPDQRLPLDGTVAVPAEVPEGDSTLPDSDSNRTIVVTGGTTKSTIPARPTSRHPPPTVASHPTVAHTTYTTTTVHGPVRAHPAATSEEASTVKILLPVIISVTIIFVSAGLIAICIFRKYLCAISKTLKKKNKIDKAKKSNQSNASSNITSGTEDSRNSIGLSHWSGPMAFSNRYTSPHYGNTHGKSKILTSGDLTSFMFQVARGMDFLTSRGSAR